MKTAFRFLKSPTGNLTLLLVFAVVGGALTYQSSSSAKRQTAQLSTIETLTPDEIKETILRDGKVLKVPIALPDSNSEAATKTKQEPASRSGAGDHRPNEAAIQPKSAILPISLFSAESPPGLSKKAAPYGRLIPCETVVTLESSKLDTPLIGLVTEDVWNDGQLIIPAGAEIHGRASVDHSRERIAASGKWIVVWRNAGPLNGTELVLSGIALDRERDDTKGEFGPLDGSAGLRGDIIKSDNLQEVKLFASTFLAGVGNGIQQMQNQTTALGSLMQVPVRSGGNAALQGTADVLNAYARQIQESIARDGFFVRVPSGKQFYLYVTETIDQSKGTRANARVDELWTKENENPTNSAAASPARRM